MNCSMPGFPVLHHIPVCSNSCLLSWWCLPTISSSVTPFSFGLQSFSASGSFPMSWLFPSGGQSIGASSSASALPMNIQGRFSLGLNSLIFQSKELSRVFSSTTIGNHQFFGASLLYGLTSIHDYWKKHSFDINKVISLLFNIVFRFVIAFLSRSKCLLISWLQSLSAVILEPRKTKSATVSTLSPSICHEVMGLVAMILVVWMLSFKSVFSLSSFTLIERLFSSSSFPAIQFSSIAAYHVSLSITNSRGLFKLMSIELVMPSSHLILCRLLLLLNHIPPSIRVFPMSQLFTWGGQNIGVSASASVLPMNTQD